MNRVLSFFSRTKPEAGVVVDEFKRAADRVEQSTAALKDRLNRDGFGEFVHDIHRSKPRKTARRSK